MDYWWFAFKIVQKPQEMIDYAISPTNIVLFHGRHFMSTLYKVRVKSSSHTEVFVQSPMRIENFDYPSVEHYYQVLVASTFCMWNFIWVGILISKTPLLLKVKIVFFFLFSNTASSFFFEESNDSLFKWTKAMKQIVDKIIWSILSTPSYDAKNQMIHRNIEESNYQLYCTPMINCRLVNCIRWEALEWLRACMELLIHLSASLQLGIYSIRSMFPSPR